MARIVSPHKAAFTPGHRSSRRLSALPECHPLPTELRGRLVYYTLYLLDGKQKNHLGFLTGALNPINPPVCEPPARALGPPTARPENAEVTGFGEITHFDPSLYGRDYRPKALIFFFPPP